MSPGEIITRTQDEARRRTWERRRVRVGSSGSVPRTNAYARVFPTRLPAGTASTVPDAARDALLGAADRLMEGRWEILGVERDDLVAPDWFLDPRTGKRAPNDRYAFRIQHRSEAVTGNVKQLWELSRHQHLTLLAAAAFVSGESRYAERVAKHLSSWWVENPFLTGVHWTSGIELGLRLISWTWIRRLLDDWPPVADLFERNDLAVQQLYWHQQYLAGFRSRGSSANNHVIAEAAGRLVAADAFPWFPESAAWRADAARVLQVELNRNTFPSGINRELASDYHGFVAELALTAAIEADAAGAPLDPTTWECIVRMTDDAAALVDCAGRPPRQGDGDDGTVLLVDGPPASGSWTSLLALGARAFGPCAWWPAAAPTVFSTVLGALLGPPCQVGSRPAVRPAAFGDAGIILLRTEADANEIWCRGDAGPHGFLRTAAHAHADALSLEVRHGGVDILADPGTYCYHGEPDWRAYFRSTAAHNTVEIARQDQSRAGGPFLWTRPAQTRVLRIERTPDGEIVRWCAEHDGYEQLDPPAGHRRSVRLDREHRTLTIVDTVTTRGEYELRLHFHLGPAVAVTLNGSVARLQWRGRDGTAHHAVLELPYELDWSVHRDESDPIAGWYAPRFGVKTPTTSLSGAGVCGGSALELHTRIEFPMTGPARATGRSC
jgi:hypothetical protein